MHLKHLQAGCWWWEVEGEEGNDDGGGDDVGGDDDCGDVVGGDDGGGVDNGGDDDGGDDDGGDDDGNDDVGGNEDCDEAGEEAATRCDTACQEQPGPGPHAAVARNWEIIVTLIKTTTVAIE